MQKNKKILILGGSSEAFELAKAINEMDGVTGITSFAGRTSLPRKPEGPYRTGGFGGSKGLTNFIETEAINIIIDATHPFAKNISLNANSTAKATNRPIIHLWRKPWQAKPGDIWHEVNSTKDAATHLHANHSPVFLTIGRLELNAFKQRTDIKFFARTIEPAKADDPNYDKTQHWPENFTFIYAKGPFTYDDEYELFTNHKIKSLVTKNSGGEKAKAKLDIARELKLPVIMINRPQAPNGPLAGTADEALTWLKSEMELV